jgi:hypothetical protein
MKMYGPSYKIVLKAIFTEVTIGWNLMPLLVSYKRFGGTCHAFFKIENYIIDKIYRFVLCHVL